ncbi:MAG: lytic transglycosylase domain-containing protein [Pseudomonadota bacterium]|nr:lytic transglycosylase domain-containing protein [Pseudomonadota bacterium]
MHLYGTLDAHVQRIRWLALAPLLLILAAVPAPVSADVWGYIDEAGQAHVAGQQIDERYQLFFKGEATPESSSSPVAHDAPADLGEQRRDVTAPASTSAPRYAKEAALRRFSPLIEKHAGRQAVDPALVKAIVAVESGFEPGAVSPKGARGLMQVMPQTAARYGVSSDKKSTAEAKLMDPAVNLQVGTRYLRDLLARFADDIVLTLAAYNAGEYAVERYRNRVPPYRETIEYVKRVQQLYAAFRPAAPPAAEPTKTASVPFAHKRIRGMFLAQPNVAQGAVEPVL